MQVVDFATLCWVGTNLPCDFIKTNHFFRCNFKLLISQKKPSEKTLWAAWAFWILLDVFILCNHRWDFRVCCNFFCKRSAAPRSPSINGVKVSEMTPHWFPRPATVPTTWSWSPWPPAIRAPSTHTHWTDAQNQSTPDYSFINCSHYLGFVLQASEGCIL